MGVIFWFSSRTADESNSQSSAILEFLIKLFGDGAFTDFIVRKCAHCLEFTGLSLLFSAAFCFTRGNANPIYAIACTSAYAVTDEVHQLFVEGRSCQVSDWVIDTCGGLIGAASFLIILFIIKKVIDRSAKEL